MKFIYNNSIINFKAKNSGYPSGGYKGVHTPLILKKIKITKAKNNLYPQKKFFREALELVMWEGPPLPSPL